jgi:hypothetical protein
VTKFALAGFSTIVLANAAVSFATSSVFDAVRNARPNWYRFPSSSVYAAVTDTLGNVFYIDPKMPAVGAIDANGRPLWTKNAKGIGPGEIQFPYRIQLDHAGKVVVLDLGAKNLLWFDREGRFIKRSNLGLAFSMVSDFTVLGDDGIAVAGLSDDARARDYAVHIVDAHGLWVRSFDFLPKNQSREIMRLAGVGSLERASWTSVYFSPKWRPEVTEYSNQGVKLRSVQLKKSLSDPKEAFTFAPRANGGMTVKAADSMSYQARAIALMNRRFVSAVLNGRHFEFSEHSADGALLDELKAGVGSAMPIAFDSVRCVALVERRDDRGLAFAQIPLGSADERRNKSRSTRRLRCGN